MLIRVNKPNETVHKLQLIFPLQLYKPGEKKEYVWKNGQNNKNNSVITISVFITLPSN